MEKHGFVYILSNDFMPDLYKVGFTTKCPYERAKALSRETSCPYPFDVVCFAEFNDARAAEKQIHNSLFKYKIQPDKEFFQISIDDLIMYASYILCAKEESNCISSTTTEIYKNIQRKFNQRLKAA